MMSLGGLKVSSKNRDEVKLKRKTSFPVSVYADLRFELPVSVDPRPVFYLVNTVTTLSIQPKLSRSAEYLPSIDSTDTL